MLASVLTTYSGKSSDVQRNLQFGIANGRWGMKRQPVDWNKDSRFDWQVIGACATGLKRGPRCQPEEWVTALLDGYVFKVTSPLVLESGAYWPDEVAESAVKYPFRFDIELMASARAVPTAYGEVLPRDISEGIRRAASPGAESIAIIGDSVWSEFVDLIAHRGRRHS